MLLLLVGLLTALSCCGESREERISRKAGAALLRLDSVIAAERRNPKPTNSYSLAQELNEHADRRTKIGLAMYAWRDSVRAIRDSLQAEAVARAVIRQLRREGLILKNGFWVSPSPRR